MSKILTDAAVKKYKKTGKRRIIRDGGSRSLYLIVQPSGHKSWMMRFRVNGKAGKMTLGPVYSGAEPAGPPVIGMPLSLQGARQLAAEVLRDRAQGHDPIADRKAARHRLRAAENDDDSFASAARSYIKEHCVANVRGWRELARILGLDPDAENLGAIPSGLVARWGDRSVRKIDFHDCWSAVDEARTVSVPGIAPRRDAASDSRARSLYAALSAFFGWCLRHRRCEVNPCDGFRPKPPAARERVLTASEVKKLWKSTDEISAPFGAVLKLLLLTGQRLNEIAELRWSEVADDAIQLPGTRTKNHRPHVVPLSGAARAILAEQRRIDGCDFVFTTNGRTPISGWSKMKLKLDAAMGAEPWRIHDLRRTAATGMADIGIQPHVVEAVLNHVSGAKAGVAGIYNRAAYAAEKKAALERWAAHISGLVGDEPTAEVVDLGRRRR